jgi:hypothetical protein
MGMKIKCVSCNKYVLQRKEVAAKAAAKEGYGSLEDYVKDYKCRDCRKGSVKPKNIMTGKEKKKVVEKEKSSEIKVDVKPKTETGVESVFEDDDEEEKEIDQTFETEEIEKDNDDGLDEELEKELGQLLEEEDDETELNPLLEEEDDEEEKV